MSELSDQECVQILQRIPQDLTDAKRVFAILFQRYDRRLQCDLRWSFPSLREHDVQELCQETWLRVWKWVADRFQGDGFRGWLFTIGRNLAKDRLRHARVASAQSLVENPVSASPNHTHEMAFAEQLQRCVEKLPEKYQTLTKALLDLETFDAIAESTNTPKARLYRVKHEIRSLLLGCLERT
jgi:RNA polymerase sigma factor (sigma-70 family)